MYLIRTQPCPILVCVEGFTFPNVSIQNKSHVGSLGFFRSLLSETCLINNVYISLYTHYGVPVIEAMATKGTYNSSAAKQKPASQRSYSQSRWFKVTFLYPSWRSLSLWKSHLTIPQGSQGIAKVKVICVLCYFNFVLLGVSMASG